MKTYLAAAISFALALPAGQAGASESQSAFERRCEREMKPVLDVRLRENGYHVNNTVSSKVLNNRGLRLGASGDKVLGLTTVQTRTEFLVDSPVLLDQGSGRECVSPRVEVDILFPRIEVYVAREFSPVSCSYRLVLAHEMRHVNLYREFQPRLLQMIRTAMEMKLGGGPLYAPAGIGPQMVDDYIDNTLRPFIRAEMAKIEQSQLEIDNEEERWALSFACQGEVRTQMSARF